MTVFVANCVRTPQVTYLSMALAQVPDEGVFCNTGGRLTCAVWMGLVCTWVGFELRVRQWVRESQWLDMGTHSLSLQFSAFIQVRLSQW